MAGLALLCQGGDAGRPHSPPFKAAQPAEASAPARPSEARLTGFSYSPYIPAPPRPARQESEPGFRGGGARNFDSEETPAALHQRGVSWLLDPDGTEKAVSMLEQAVQLSPKEASLWSDLSAAYHARAERRGDPVDLLPAFRAARRAVELGGSRPEARFNLALSYEKLYLPQARRAWGDYLKLNQGEPAWAREAAERFFSLAAPSSASASTKTRELAERKLLGDWAAQRLAGRPEDAARVLAQVREIGTALRTSAEDDFLFETVEVIDRSSGAGLDLLTRGHEAFQRGRELEAPNPKEAVESFRTAEALLNRAGSPFAAMARLEAAIVLYRTRSFQRALDSLDLLTGDLRDATYPSLQGRVAWMTGLARAAAGDSSGALSSYRSALALFERTGETDRVGRMQNLIAETSWLLGDSRGAWRAFHASLAALPAGGDPRSLLPVFYLASKGAFTLEEPEAALAFQEAAVDLGRSSSDPALLSYALLGRASLLEKLGRPQDAVRDLAEAERAAVGIAEPQIAAQTRADLAIIGGEIGLATDPEEAVRRLTEALRGYGSLKSGGVLSPIHLARARARLALRDEAGAEEDLLAAAATVEGQRERLAEEDLRISYLDDSKEVYREIVRFYLERGDAARAFAFTERARSRTLLDHLGGAVRQPGRPLELSEIQARLPERVVLIEISVDEKGGAKAWIVRRDLFRVVSLPRMEPGRLENDVERFRAAVEAGSGRKELARLSSELSRQLLENVLPLVPAESLAVFIPDGPLHRLPFAALVNPATGLYLMEERAIAFAPSASAYVYALERDAGRTGSGLLAVGDPAFDTEAFPLLSRLRGADAEVRRLQRIYPDSLFLKPAEATKERFLALAGQFPLVHYAGHTLLHRESPALSSLVLAGKGLESALYSGEIYRSWFPRTRLIVLASCSSADGWTSRSEGLLSLARSFLAAGVPAVVATAWPVGDEASSHLFTSFHRNLRAGQTAPSALRSAQRELLRSRDPRLNSPASWAGVVAIGGVRLQP